MTVMHLLYWIACLASILMFGASWVIRRRNITEGPLARAEKPPMLAGAGTVFVVAIVGFNTF